MARTPTQTTIARSTIMRSIMRSITRSTTRSIMVVSTVTRRRRRNVDDMKATDIMKAAAAAIMDRPVLMVMVDMVMKVSMDSRDMEQDLTEEVLFLPL
jgi:hypothetical protein